MTKRFALLTSTLLGLVLGAFILTVVMLSPVQAQPDDDYITIVKGPATQVIVYNTEARFNITVTSTYTGTLTDVEISDPLAPNCNRNIGTLAAGASENYTCSRSGVTEDFVNVATVEGFRWVGPANFDVGDTSGDADVDVIAPAITIAKMPNSQTIASGYAATFDIVVTNTGDADLTNVTVTDALASDCDRVFASLNSGQSENYSCNVENVTSSFTNVAQVSGEPPAGPDVTDSDDADVVVDHPGISISKTPNLQLALSGDTVEFGIAVTNNGDVPLSDVAVTDALAPDCDRVVGGLSLGGSSSYTCTAMVTTDMTNTAVVTGTPPVGPNVSDQDTAIVDVVAPEVSINKTDDIQTVNSGESADFTITIENTGSADLTNVIVTDPESPLCNNVRASLPVGASWNYSCSSTAVTQGFINIATVSGEPPAGAGSVVTDADSARVGLAETQAACPVDMFAYWRLDESGGNVYDDYYTGYDAVCDGQCPTATTSGVINGAQTFNGNDTGLSVSPVPGVPTSQFNWLENDSFSIELWMQTGPGACVGNEVVIGRVEASNQLGGQWWVGCWNDGEAAFVLIDRAGNGPEHLLHGSTDLTADDEWHHIVATRDASADEVRLYVDGLLEDSSAAGDYTNFIFSGNAVNIGWINMGSGGFHFTGSVDEAALYDRVLSSTEVFRHYQEGQMNQQWYCVPDAPFSPVIVSTPVTETAVQKPYTYDVESFGDPTPVYTLTLNPSGMTIDPVTGLISWKPVVSQQGSHAVTVVATNTVGTDLQSFDIEVLEGPICSENMVSYWKLDEETPGVYADFYDGNDAICRGEQCPTPTILAQVNRAQMFGSGDELNVPADESFNWGVNDSFSIEFWMNADQGNSCSANQVAIGRDRADTSAYWWVGCWSGGAPFFVLIDENDTSPSRWLSGTTNLTGGGWHHIVAVRDASADEIYLYVDNVLEDSLSVNYPAGFSSSASVNIGHLSAAYNFVGTLDEVALYNKALNPDEIEQHYQRGQVLGIGYCVTPEIGIAKSANPSTAYAGSLITYTYTVHNPGDDPLSSVSVSDDQCDVPTEPDAGDVGNSGVLDLDEFWTYHCYKTLHQDTTNTVVVEGVYSLGGVVSDTATASVNIIHPAIAVDKQVTPTLIYAGETVTFTFTVTNPGDDPLSLVGISDDQCSNVEYVMGNINLDNWLDQDETWIYTCSTMLNADTINTATVTGTDSLGGIVDDMATVSVNVINSDINIDKQANPDVIYAGDRVTYTYTISNPQEDSLSNVIVSDLCAPITYVEGDNSPYDELDPDEIWTYTCSTEVFTDTINVATVIANDPLNGVVSDTAMALVNVINPNISIEKWANSTIVYAGDLVTYTYNVANPGDDPLAGVGVSDDVCGPVTFVGGDNNQDNELDPGEIWIHTCSMTLFIDTTNTAIVTGTDSLNSIVSDTAILLVDVISPDITIDKQANPEMIYAGETVTYTYTVNNPQDDSLSNVSVSDDQCSPVIFEAGDDAPNNGKLDLDETWTYTCSMALYADTTNMAIVTGVNSLSDIVSDTTTAFVNVISPAISIDKRASSVAVSAGDAVTYTYIVINSGDDVLSNVSTSDDQCSPVALVAGDDNLNDKLDSQETWTYTCVTELLTNTTNVAIVTGVDSLDGTVSDTDTATVLVSEVWYPLYLPIVLNNASALR